MTAQAHFMRHRYSGFDQPLEIVPPSGVRALQHTLNTGANEA